MAVDRFEVKEGIQPLQTLMGAAMAITGLGLMADAAGPATPTAPQATVNAPKPGGMA